MDRDSSVGKKENYVAVAIHITIKSVADVSTTLTWPPICKLKTWTFMEVSYFLFSIFIRHLEIFKSV